jgi:hypothetical protein
MHTTTATGASPMTDQATLDRLIADAEAELFAAIRWAGTAEQSAPLALKVRDQERIRRAEAELEALRELVAEAKAMTYQELITALAPDADPRHVEAWMRLEHPTLDGLSPERFTAEVRVALGCIADAGPDQSEALAASFGI